MTDAKKQFLEAQDTDTRVLTLTERDLADTRRLLSLLDAEYSAAGHSDDQDATNVPRKRLIERAREILDNRRRRISVFGRAMFDEAAWEMLLLLYVTQDGPRQTVSRLAHLSGFSKSTALRWLDYLDQHRLVRRDPHPTDKRSAFVGLTEEGREKLELYLSGTRLSNG